VIHPPLRSADIERLRGNEAPTTPARCKQSAIVDL